MVFTGKLSAEKRAYVAYLARDKDFKTAAICKKSGISRATVYRIKREKQWEGKGKEIKKMGGRPRKLNGRDERKILRTLKSQTEGNYSTAQIMSTAGISARQVSTRTVRRYLNKNGYFSLQARKKGLLSEADCKVNTPWHFM